MNIHCKGLKCLLPLLVASLVLIGAELLAQSSIEVELTPAAYKIVKNKLNYDIIEMDGFMQGGSPGDPMLPHKVYNILLPPDVDWSSLEMTILGYQTEELSGTYDIGPAPVPATWKDGKWIFDWGEGKKIVAGKNINIYGISASYPEENAALLPYSQLRKWKFTKVDFYPFQYDPVSKTLRLVTSMTIDISYSITPQPLDSALADTVMDEFAPQLFYNYPSAKEWYRSTAAPSLKGYDYVIITTNAYVSGSTKLSSFVTHKTNLGHSVLVVTETAYGGLTPQAGSGTAGKIRQWLINNYITYGIEYVLLIGDPDPDSGDVPMLKCWPRYDKTSDKDSPTDYFVADLTGDWDLDNDTIYGEYNGDRGTGGVDFYAEVFVGRIPVYGDDYATLDSILQKMINYDNMKGSRTWRKKLLLPEAISNYANEDGSGSYRTCGHELADWLKVRLPDMTPYTLYEKAGLTPCTAACNAPLTRGNVRSEWGNGYGMVVWWGHGSNTQAWRKYWLYDDGNGVPEGAEMAWVTFFESSDASPSYLDNTKPSWAYLCSCFNGNPDSSNNLGTALLKHGAIATIAASRVSWYAIGWGIWGPFGLKGYADNATLGYFMAEKTGALNATFGKGVFFTKQEVGWGFSGASWMNLMDFNLFGDPSQRICAANPNDIAVGQGPSSVSQAKDFSYSGSVLASFQAFTSGNPNGELSVAKGDVTGDGVPEIVVGQRSSGAKSRVAVFAEDGTQLLGFKAFGTVNPSGMVNVAVGDVDMDGVAEIVVAQGPGGKSWVKVFDYGNPPTLLTSFKAFGASNANGEVRVAAGNTTALLGEIITGHGHGGSSWVKVWDYSTPPSLYKSFKAYGAKNPSGGVDVGLGNFDNALNGRQLIAVGQGGPGTTAAAAAKSFVKIFTELGTLKTSFKAFGVSNPSGRVTVDGGQGDNTDVNEEIIVGQGVGGQSWVKVFDYGTPPTLAHAFKAFGAANAQGQVDVAGKSFSNANWSENFNDGVANNFYDDDSGNWSVSGNEFIMIQGDATNFPWSGAYYNRVYTDFSYAIDVKRVSGPTTKSQALLFRGVDTGNTYMFNIADDTVDAYYSLWVRSGGLDYKMLVGWTTTPHVSMGLNVWNTLQVVCIGPTIALYANGNLLTTVNDNTYTSGKVGVGSYADADGYEVHFDNLKFRKATLGPAAPPPASSPSKETKETVKKGTPLSGKVK